MGSDSDLKTMNDASLVLSEFGVSFEIQILSAHRTPDEMSSFAKRALKRGIRVIIAGAGGAAHLPGMIASYTELPVIGVPVPVGVMEGQDSLLSIVQMPRGVPVATVAIGNSYNAALLAVQILAAGGLRPDARLQKKISHFKRKLKLQVKKKNRGLQKKSK
jgi:5-(carboxyamino)imidazole ribonucleotide mutase